MTSNKQTPTAEEFYKSVVGASPIGHTREIMIEFAKLHVQAALKAASEKAQAGLETAHFAEGSYGVPVVNQSTILDSYPLDNIR
jgi:hypothetical protein